MITLETLIKNEVKDALGHEPTQAEMNSVSEYLATKTIKSLVELEIEITIGWKHLYTDKCPWCEERFLTTEMIQTVTGEHFCCEQCKKDYETEHGRITEC